MASGDLTVEAAGVTIVDSNDDVAITAAIAAINLANTTDKLFVVPVGQQNKFAIFGVERAA